MAVILVTGMAKFKEFAVKLVIIMCVMMMAISSQAALVNSIYLQGIVTNNFQNNTYVSVRDSFDQEYVLPKKLIEKKTGRKVAGQSQREFKGAIYFFEISTGEYAALTKQCQVDIKPSRAQTTKKCPPSI